MFARMMVALTLVMIASSCYAQAIPPASSAEVDSSEVYRRGDSVTVAGEGPRSPAIEAGNAATAPPEDDSHKWFITVWSIKGCAACDRLKADFQRAPELLAFVSAPEPSKAWAHYNVFDGRDQTQEFRRKKLPIQAYPTILIQPPRNETWGDPANVVWYQTGYSGEPKKLAAAITAGVRKYAAAMAQRGYPKQPKQLPVQDFKPASSHSEGEDEAKDRAPAEAAPAKATQAKTALYVTQAIHSVPLLAQTAPFEVPSRPDPFNPQPLYPNDQPLAWPPRDQPTPQVFPQLPSLGDSFLASPTLTNLILLGVVGYFGIQYLRNRPSTSPKTRGRG